MADIKMKFESVTEMSQIMSEAQQRHCTEIRKWGLVGHWWR